MIYTKVVGTYLGKRLIFFSSLSLADGRMCIRFGMVSMETDVEELLGLVLKSGTDLDDKVYQLQNMSELVKKGIEQAQTDLRKESDDLIWQEGILRHVPLVGSIYNWISPAQKVKNYFGTYIH